MNPVLKKHVYAKGNILQLRFIAAISGMSLDERKMLLMYHNGKSDLDVEAKLGITKQAREELEVTLAAKVSIGIILCIDKAMDILDVTSIIQDPLDLHDLLEN